jgi:nicotinamidase-related amidase
MFTRVALSLAIGIAATFAIADVADDSSPLKLNLRSRVKTADGKFETVEKPTEWDPKKTALVICDMWDHHWCKSAEERVGELTGPLNEMVKQARQQGVFIIHAPSTCTGFYEGTPARKLAQQAPFVQPPVPLADTERWGTMWCWPDPQREPELPIDDTDMGCDCAEKCEIVPPWTRQTAGIEILPGDALTDNGQETWNLLAERGIDNVILCGVHLNMCVLGRPFAIRQMVRLGKNVVLVRDMTDTMYNPKMRPQVSHFKGTDLMVEHVERYWCPSFASSDITGGKTFKFKGARN